MRKIVSLLFFLIVTNVGYGQADIITSKVDTDNIVGISAFYDSTEQSDTLINHDETKLSEYEKRLRAAKEKGDSELFLVNTIAIILFVAFLIWIFSSAYKTAVKEIDLDEWKKEMTKFPQRPLTQKEVQKIENLIDNKKKRMVANNIKTVEERKTTPQPQSPPSKREQLKSTEIENKTKEIKAVEIVRKSNVAPLKTKNKSEEIISQNIDLETKEIEFVDYQIFQSDNTDNYPILKTPAKGCVIRTHRFGKSKRRGYKEESFQNSAQKYFGVLFQVSGDIRLNTGKETRPFEPDIAIIGKNTNKNIRIDIEIDEPYSGINRQPTHCKGEDDMRDIYFTDRGWIVVRFSEYQVHTQELACLKYIANIIRRIDTNYIVPAQLNSAQTLEKENLWDIVQAQKWEREKYREKYLGIDEFGIIKNNTETIERDFSEQELKEEQLVQSTTIGVSDKDKKIGFNETNYQERDKRIAFYPENHLYTIDNISAPSVTTIISKFFPEFDTVYWSNRKSFELGLPPEEIALQWKKKGEKAAQKGTFLHEQIEKYYLQQQYQQTEEFHLFEQFANEHNHLKPYRSEWRIFDEDFHIAGTIDLIVENNGVFEIYDWKRSKKVVSIYGKPITENDWQCGIGKLQDIPDTSYNRYSLQQSLYRYILERKYDLKISKMYLIVLHPNYEQYYKVEVPYLKNQAEYMLKTL